MKFFSVFDIISYVARLKGHTKDMVYLYFRKAGIKKEDLIALQNSSMIPHDEQFITAILSYLNMTRLELELSLNRVPKGYESLYLDKIKEIARIIENDEKPDDDYFISTYKIEPFFKTELGELYNGDALKLFKSVPGNYVDTVFADPPFNLAKEYDEGVNDSKTLSEYLNWCFSWLDECVRVLKPNGSLFVYNIPKWHTYISNYLNQKVNFWDWITIDMKFSLPIQNRLYPAHYSLLYYVKGSKPKTFNNQRIPLTTCRHCSRELKDYGGYKNKMNPNGVNVSDVWTDIYPVRHNNTKNIKFNELPVKLLDRVISMSTNENDIVLDPFGGSGTTYAVCELLGRRWIGFEIGNCEVIKDRLIQKDGDKELLDKVYEEKNKLFPDKVKKIRIDKGYWVAEDFKINED